jgi:cytochrome c553
MPDIVARGKEPDVIACALCHYPNGKGRPENAGIAGLPVEYFIQQLEDFRNDVRVSAESRKGNVGLMVQIAKGMTGEEIQQAAEYYASMAWTPWFRVVETDTVPVMRIQGGVHFPIEGGGNEPIGTRIVETPEDAELSELRDPRSGFIAYAPVGSIERGRELAAAGNCTLCHGPNLEGLGPVPGIAGRSPSYMARQLYDMQQNARRGLWTELMEPVVVGLSPEDIVAISAYTASIAP